MLTSFFEAVRFLTLIPLPFMPATTGDNYEQTIARSMVWFPAVGLLIGGLASAIGLIAGVVWTELVRAVMIVVVIGIITSGLHLDGLSDTFDAVMSWRSRERKLEIMKDSRIGAMGAIALVVIIALKIAFITAAGTSWWRAVLISTTLGRWADIYGIFVFPSAREGGLGRNFRDFIQRDAFVFATVQAMVILLVVALIGQPLSLWPVLLVRDAIMLIVLFVANHTLCAWWTRSLGGLTGDTYGALCEISEVVVLAAMSAVA